MSGASQENNTYVFFMHAVVSTAPIALHQETTSDDAQCSLAARRRVVRVLAVVVCLSVRPSVIFLISRCSTEMAKRVDHANNTVAQKSFLLSVSVFMAALRSRCGHYIFALWFLSVFYLLLFLA